MFFKTVKKFLNKKKQKNKKKKKGVLTQGKSC